MFCRTLSRETEHCNARFFETSHRLRCLCRTNGNLCQLVSIGHRSYGNVANNQDTVLAILWSLSEHKHSSADTCDSWLSLDDLEGRAQCVACRRECTAYLSISVASLYYHTSEIERVLHQLASLLNGHTLLLAKFSEQLSILFALLAVLWVYECCLVNVLQSETVSQSMYFLRISNQNKVSNVFSQHTVGCCQCTLLLCLWEHDALLVTLSTRDDLLH